jgi:ATP-dependent exoDNAse (exonuclease V) alpha subunit
MNPRLNVGKGVTGAVRYVLGQGRDPKTGELKELAPGEQSRVAWMSGQGFGFDINTTDDVHLARRMMEFDALNQASRTRKCEQDCVHLTLAWRPGETLTQKEMEDAARDALKALGMENARALFVSHNDEDYAHVHIVASKINPDTGRAYDLEKSWRKLSTWAEKHEREHGGVISVRREDANELRAAIRDRDAEGVLDAMTKQRSTFTGKQLEQALAKEMKNEIERAQFGNQILSHAQTIHLADKPDGPVARYTSRTVLEAELHVLRAAEGLASNKEHAISDGERARVLNGAKFEGITREQARAFRHATGAEGLAIIDGQAGTGKSFTMAAIRETYEKAGYRVIGLGPTNAVAQDMRADGFGHAATIHSELFALNNNRTSWNRRTVVMVDEAAMLDTKLMAMVTAHAHEAGAKLILAGDDRQLSSIDRGGMFGALKDRHGCAELSEVKRQHKIDERRAAEWMASGNFQDALGIYEQKGAIHWTRTQVQARAGLVDQWAKDSAASPDKSRFVFAYTNDDVATLNASLRAVRKERGELGEDHQLNTAHGRYAFAAGDRIQFTGTDKRAGLMNGSAGTIETIDGTEITMKLDGRKGATITFDAAAFDKFRHGYAGTIYRGQGRTLDQTYLYHSEHWRSAPSYVALTRHREKAEIFVATNTLNTRQQGEPWMMAKGGEPALSQEHYDSAKRSYEKWKETNPEAAARHGFADYVQYVQDQWAKKAPEPENDRAANLRTLARQMGRVDDRRAASMFYHQQDIGPVRPLTARETLEKFGGAWSRPPEDRRADPAQQQTAQRSVQNNEPPQLRPQQPAETRQAASRDERAENPRDTIRQRTSEQTQTTDSEETEKAAKLNNPERQRQATLGHGRGRSRSR